MQKVLFTNNWTVRKKGENQCEAVDIPHDAMRYEPKSQSAAAGVNNGWIECSDYVYEKHFDKSELGGKACACVEFECVYKDAVVTLNGTEICRNDYGFGNFYVDIVPFVKEGDNLLAVSVTNSDQPNCRWYSGTGILRPVWLYLSDEKHILSDSVRITTKDYVTKTVLVQGKVSHSGVVNVQIYDGNKIVAANDADVSDGAFETSFTLSDCLLWSTDNPKLYTAKVVYLTDSLSVTFGIRQVELSTKKGLLLNGSRVLLNGACIHADNGILGAVSLAEVEERKIRLLKNCGYNAIRSAHNPSAKSLLDACDRLGVLVVDEYVDMWYVHKNKYDYADKCRKNFDSDITAMVAKDYNHPCVVLYSLGNEVGESCNDEGVAFFNDMKNVINREDGTRPVTVGVNITFNLMYSLGMGVYSDKKAEDASRKVGSEFFNHIAGLVGSHVMKNIARLHGCDVKTRKIFAASDVAGYNYGILRYRHDLRKYPNRLILGTETFCNDIVRYKKAADENPRLIGDFVWAGMDYLGEVGVGAWEHDDYAEDFTHNVGWVAAGSGRLDLVGNETAEAMLTKTVYVDQQPRLAVIPVHKTNDKHSPSAWKCSNAVASWNWQGYEGTEAKIEVYSVAESVELWLDDKLIGRKKTAKNGITRFKTKYKQGKLKVVQHDINGNCTGESVLQSGSGCRLKIWAESRNDNDKLAFVHLDYVDDNDNITPLSRGKINVSVDGGKLLALGHACPYNVDGYLNDETDTYYGRALAVVRLEGKTEISATSPYGNASLVLNL